MKNYLHPVNEDLILALGQNTTEEGWTDGLQISLFNVSDFASPQRVRQYVESSSNSISDAQYEHKAFRYLPDSKLLILPLSVNAWCGQPDFAEKFFDGFVVYDVDETRDFSKKFNISHVTPEDACNWCWSRDELSSRSLVFNGAVMTLKGHNVLSHELTDGNFRWELNLDYDTKEKSDFCYAWK
jgi:Secreted protein containing C-terminal beta-propeller domain distantly related to WD-40 repeats